MIVAANDPFNLTMLEAMRLVTKSRVQLALCTEADIAKALKRYYGVGAETLDELMQIPADGFLQPYVRLKPELLRRIRNSAGDSRHIPLEYWELLVEQDLVEPDV